MAVAQPSSVSPPADLRMHTTQLATPGSHPVNAVLQRQWSASPTRFWSTGLQDYLRNVAKIRREFADVLGDDGALAGWP